jgi:hypothetical protein
MPSKSRITDAIVRKLGEMDPGTGQTYWQSMLDLLRQEAQGGNPRVVKLLKQYEAIDKKHPEFSAAGMTRDGGDR